MLITHHEYEIEVGPAHQRADGRYTVAWAAYKGARAHGPIGGGMTMTFLDPDTAVATACAEARITVNELG